jgi:hypothetical protein
VEVDSSGISGSPLPSPRRATKVSKVSSLRRSDQGVREKGAGSSSRPGTRPAREDQTVTRSQVPRPCAWCVYIVRVLVCATHRSISSTTSVPKYKHY